MLWNQLQAEQLPQQIEIETDHRERMPSKALARRIH